MNFRFIVVPDLAADETVTSFLSRTANYNYGGTLRAECLRLLGRKKPLLATVPCSIDLFSRAFGMRFGNAVRVLNKHTLFDFYACGVPAERITNFQKRLIEPTTGPLRPARLPLLFDRVSSESYGCPECDAKNFDEHGFSFERRQNTAPFVTVCSWHAIHLISRVQDGHLYDRICNSRHPGSPAFVNEFAVRSSASVSNSWNESGYCRESIVAMMTANRWVSSSGRCAIGPFLTAFHKKFSRVFGDERLRLLCSDKQYAERALRTLLRPDRNLHPTWCILFRWLADEAEHCSSVTRAPVARRTDIFPSTPPATPIFPEHMPTTRLEMKPSVSVKSAPRRTCFSAELLHQVTVFHHAGIPTFDVSELCGVSLSTAYRILSGIPGKTDFRALQVQKRIQTSRANWQRAVKDEPGLTATELRFKNYADWTALYRHDRAWLIANSSRALRKPHQQRTPLSPALAAIASQSIAEAALVCETLNRRPIRRSAYRLSALTGLSEYELERLASPRKRHLFDKKSESHSSFVVRRFRWLTARDTDAATDAHWEQAKKSGLRCYSIASVIYDLNQPSQTWSGKGPR